MTVRVCPVCGARNQSSGGFCASCGTYLEWADEPGADPAAGSMDRTPGRTTADRTPPASDPRSRPGPPPPSAPAQWPATDPPPGSGRAPGAARRPAEDPRGRRAGLLPHQPLTASAVPGHTLVGPPTGTAAGPGGTWLTPPPGPEVVRTGGMCHRCGRVNPTGRRYCRCGHRLQPYEPPPAAGASPPPESGAREFDRAMRAAGKGRRPRFDKPLSSRTRVFRGVSVGALFALALIPITPPGASAIGRLSDTAGSLVPYEYQEVDTDGAAVEPTEAAVPLYVPDDAIDRAGNRAWAVAWTDPPPAETCGASAAPTLVVGFAGTADVSRVIVNAGLDPADANRARQAVPAVIDIDFANGECERLTLADGPGDQEFRVSSGPARQARVQIVAVAEAKGQDRGDQQPLTALSEIRFYQG